MGLFGITILISAQSAHDHKVDLFCFLDVQQGLGHRAALNRPFQFVLEHPPVFFLQLWKIFGTQHKITMSGDMGQYNLYIVIAPYEGYGCLLYTSDAADAL